MTELKNRTIIYVWKDSYPWDIRVDKITAALNEAGANVIILARWKGEALERETISGINIIRVGFNKKGAISLPFPFNPIWIKSINKTLNEFKPDLIIVREIMLAEDCGVIGKKNNIPIVIDMAENYPAAMREWKKYNSSFISKFCMHKLRIPDVVEKRSLKLMNGAIVVCEEQIERLNRLYKYNSNDICIVHNTPQLSQFKDFTPKVIEKPIIFGHHGYMSAEKSLANLILGFDIAANEFPEIRLNLLGAGECYEDYINLISTLTNKDKIHAPGFYKYEDLADFLNNLDVGIIPYQVSDFNNYTIHNKIFDFWALGKPVLTSLAPPLKRVVNETKSGMALDFSSSEAAANSIKEFILNYKKEYSINALAASQNKYNWSFDSKVLIDFIKEKLK